MGSTTKVIKQKGKSTIFDYEEKITRKEKGKTEPKIDKLAWLKADPLQNPLPNPKFTMMQLWRR